MKKTFLLILILISPMTFAQLGNMFSKNPIVNSENFDKQKIHYGYFLGFNSYDFKFTYKAKTPVIQDQTTVGFNVGLITNLRINDYLDIRFEPGLYFNQRNLTFPGFAKQFDAVHDVKSTYLHFPLLLKFSAERTGNIKPYLLAGAGLGLNLSSNQLVDDDNANGVFRMKKWTNFYEIGFGTDLYFEYFKFSPSIRGVFSFKDELVPDKDPNSPWTSNIQSMQTRAVFVNFSFH